MSCAVDGTALVSLMTLKGSGAGIAMVPVCGIMVTWVSEPGATGFDDS